MSEPAQSPTEAVLAKAMRDFCPGDEISIATDADSYRHLTKKPPVVLIAIVRPGFAGVLAIDASEYDGLALAELAGWEFSHGPTALERATAELDASSKRR